MKRYPNLISLPSFLQHAKSYLGIIKRITGGKMLGETYATGHMSYN